MAGALDDALVHAIIGLRDDLRQQLLAEQPFADGVLLSSALPTHTHAGADINSGTVAAARLGASPTAGKLLFGDNTWATLTSGDIPTHTHAGADINSGTVAAARLGASPTATKLLFGDNTWAILAASDIPSLAASILTSGTVATARLGSSTANSSTFLRGDQVWAVPPSSGPTGSGASTQVAYWSSASVLAGDSGLIYTAGTNRLDVVGNLVAGGLATGAGVVWSLGGFTSSGDAASNGSVSATVAGTTYKLMTKA